MQQFSCRNYIILLWFVIIIILLPLHVTQVNFKYVIINNYYYYKIRDKLTLGTHLQVFSKTFAFALIFLQGKLYHCGNNVIVILYPHSVSLQQSYIFIHMYIYSNFFNRFFSEYKYYPWTCTAQQPMPRRKSCHHLWDQRITNNCMDHKFWTIRIWLIFWSGKSET